MQPDHGSMGRYRFWQHHERKRVVMELTGLPSTKRTHTFSSPATNSP
jgi:hypothetical protein